ncbi:MAG: glycosyltransferase [Phycisphaerales bacterium]|nr:glycosyltransferase [Phycisphaerales bacterium]
MRVLLLADRVFAAHERALIERIAVGLVAEGIDVHCALPAQNEGSRALFTLAREPVVYNDRGLAFTQRIRAAQVARQIAGDELADAIDIVHVFGGSAWGMGRELGELFDCPVAYEIWRVGMADKAARMTPRANGREGFFAPDTPIERALVKAGVGESVRLTPWGAVVPQDAKKLFEANRTHAVVLMSSGRERERCSAAFGGLIEAIGQREDVLVFVNASAAESGGIWKQAKALGVLNRVTVVEQMEDRRDLVLRCDMLVYPDARHEQRTVLLDAMAAGMVVVAARDELVTILKEYESASIVETPSKEEWREKIGQFLENPEHARALGMQARSQMQHHRRAGVHIASLVDAYAWLTEIGSPRSV